MNIHYKIAYTESPKPALFRINDISGVKYLNLKRAQLSKKKF
jgi:hypothetical protein